MEGALNGPFGRVTLGATPLTIGGTPDNQLILADASISSHHAEIRPQGQDYVLIDLGSATGTFLDERRLDPYVPSLLHAEDTVRIGDTRFTYEVAGVSETAPTAYSGSHQEGEPGSPMDAGLSVPATGYGSSQPAAYPPGPPYPGASAIDYGSDAQSAAYQPSPPPPAGFESAIYPPSPSYYGAPAPTQGPRHRGLWIILGTIGALVVIGLVLFGVLAYVNRPTPTKSLNAFCNALKSGDYQTAYHQLSSGLQSKFGSEAQFAAGFASNLGLGKITNCMVTNVNDAAGTGTISTTFASGSTLVDDYILVSENGTWKINSQQPRSTPTLTLHTYCDALNRSDYPTAYTQLSSAAQSQESESQFAANFSSGQPTSCTVDQLNDAAGTGTITYTFSSGTKITADLTLANESGTWKINSQQPPSTPTLTLLTYCGILKSGNYPTAYTQLSSAAQSQESESQFAANFSSGQLADCMVSNVNDAAGSGTITYTFSGGTKITADYTLVNEGGTWKIQREQVRSTPTLTLLLFCSALKSGNIPAAYNLLSSGRQHQQSEAQFANLWTAKVINCMVSNVNDTAGTGTITFIFANGLGNARDYTLIDENGTWKIVIGVLRQP
jgi:hypothetical protein